MKYRDNYIELTTIENGRPAALFIQSGEVVAVVQMVDAQRPKINARIVCRADRPDLYVIEEAAMVVRKLQADPEPEAKVPAKAGPEPYARHFESFAVYRSFFPKPGEPPVDLNGIQKAANCVKPISRGKLYEAIQIWISMGLVESIPARDQSEAATYRLMPVAELPKPAATPIEIDLSEPGEPEDDGHLPFADPP